ncbi:hypothetical protein ACTU45_15975 [Streptomyces sp. 24-1644]
MVAPGETRVMEVGTMAPGPQIYTAKHLDGSLTSPFRLGCG